MIKVFVLLNVFITSNFLYENNSGNTISENSIYYKDYAVVGNTEYGKYRTNYSIHLVVRANCVSTGCIIKNVKVNTEDGYERVTHHKIWGKKNRYYVNWGYNKYYFQI